MKIILGLYVLLISACVTLPAEVDLYSMHGSYVRAVENKNYQEIVDDLLSSRSKKEVSVLLSGSNFEDEFPILSSYSSALVKEIGHYQKIKGDQGCLTINGFDSGSEPTSLNVEYIKEDGGWKLDYVQIVYHDSDVGFKEVAVCPPRQ